MTVLPLATLFCIFCAFSWRCPQLVLGCHNFQCHDQFLYNLKTNQSNISLNIYRKSPQVHQDLHLLANNFQKFDRFWILHTHWKWQILLADLWIYPERHLLLQIKQLAHKNVSNLLNFYSKDNNATSWLFMSILLLCYIIMSLHCWLWANIVLMILLKSLNK